MDKRISDLLKKTEYSFEDLVLIMELLRSEGGCPWDREQTHESIRKNFIEETYEVVDAIDRGDSSALKEELGDVLLQVVFHARMEEEQGSFDINGVCDDICKKLIVRHPHIFADVDAEDSATVLRNWEDIKNKTKGMKKTGETLAAVPAVLPSLMRAQKVQSRAAKVGFDFPTVLEALDKLEEEVDELKAALAGAGDPDEELGDVLFSAVNVARFSHIDAEESLFKANEKFISRFTRMESAAEAEGVSLKDADLPYMDKLWERVKDKK